MPWILMVYSWNNDVKWCCEITSCYGMKNDVKTLCHDIFDNHVWKCCCKGCKMPPPNDGVLLLIKLAKHTLNNDAMTWNMGPQ